ncbi:ABC transporter permease [Naasia lichenicola]|uniref:ABC transporter permease n=1 Tax=Naasia lichenicola TaxID=2565933 RepID=A0A4S4FLB1_9MICO|nr:ABC transporter permease [Naasia lichenicola]THG30864.1 ABC transporter permease [Naasia lichenicola]
MTVTAATTGAPAPSPEHPHLAVPPRNFKTPIVLSVLALLTFVVFGLLGDASDVTFRLSDANDAVPLAPLVVPSQLFCIVLGVLSLLLTAFAYVQAVRRRGVPLWVSLVVGAFFVVALFASVGAGNSVPVVFILTGAIGLSTAVIFGSLAGVIGERVGVANIAIEGQLLAGAFVSAVVASVTDSLFLGLIAAMIGGALVSMVLAVFSLRYVVDQIVVGVVLNVLVIGLTNFFYSAVLADNAETFNFPGTLPYLPIPLLSDIPVLGPVLFNQRITTYVMFLLVPTVWFVLFKTRWGLRIRAVGEHPLAADTVGINVNRTRFWTVTIAGTIAGFGGAALTLGSVGAFVREMSAGQGFIALAAVILGRWNPWLAAVAALLFGFSRNFRIWAGQIGSPIPADLIAMTPYVVTLIAVSVLVGRAVAPAAVGKPYIKE